MMALLTLGIALVGGIFAFGFTRGFVRRKLRFVDAVRSPLAPVMAAVVGAIIIIPLTWIPIVSWLVTGFTAALVGVGSGLGTASGVKALKRGD